MEHGCVAEHLSDYQRQEPEHSQPPVPPLRARGEWPETTSVGGFAVHNRHQRRVREELHCSHEEHQACLPGHVKLLKHRQPCGFLGEEGPHESQHRLHNPT